MNVLHSAKNSVLLGAVLLIAACIGGAAQSRAAALDFHETLKSVVSVLPEWPADVSRTEEPEGSGVVVLDGRSILTAAHVVDRALTIRVRTSSGDILDATLIGSDRATDLALLRIDTPLPVLEFAGDAALGARACAIGNSFGIGLSVTCGTVSAVNRSGVDLNAIEDFVQTDAAVNPGASGGALIDERGTLIGVLSAIFTKSSDANIGINFAVSAPLSKKVAQELLTNGRVTWRFGGLGLLQHPPRGKTGEMAAQVKHIRKGSPAEGIGLQVGDRVIWADDRRIRKPSDFRSYLARKSEGDRVMLKVRRGDEMLEMALTL